MYETTLLEADYLPKFKPGKGYDDVSLIYECPVCRDFREYETNSFNYPIWKSIAVCQEIL
jgi:hypothetical protein